MKDPRRPDHGVPGQCLTAGAAVAVWAQEVAEAAQGVRGATDEIGDVWKGTAAEQFAVSIAVLDAQATPVADRWGRIARALDAYGSTLAALQVDGDSARRALTDAEDEIEVLERRLARAQAELLAGDGTAAGQVRQLRGQIADEGRVVSGALRALEDIADARTRLDSRTVEDLLDAPGPRAQEWAGIAYQANGAPRPDDEVLRDLVDRLQGPALTAGDYDLLAQFLALHGHDPDAMADLVAALGAAGLVGIINSFAATGLENLHPPSEIGSEALCSALAAALAAASVTWSAQEQAEFGRALIDAAGVNLQQVVGAEVTGAHAVALLLGSGGLAPGVALGAFERVEQIRGQDEARFAALTFSGGVRDTGSGVWEHQPANLMATIFAQLCRAPGAARRFFGSRPGEVTAYWFGQHDWSGNQFAAPAALLDAIVNDPAAQVDRYAHPPTAGWAATVAFASQAFEALGGNLTLTLGTLSTEASVDIAQALGAFAPEIAAGLLTIGGDQKAEDVTTAGPRGAMVEVPRLTARPGNLGRLLGVATVDRDALATFGMCVAAYAARVRSLVTGPDHPTLSAARDALRGAVALFAMLHASYSLEAANHAQRVSDEARAGLDSLFGLLALLPVGSAGNVVVDFVPQVGAVGAEQVAERLWPGVKSPQEIDAIVEAGHAAGDDVLSEYRGALAADWAQIGPPYVTEGGTLAAPGDLLDQMVGQYHTTAGAFGNDNGTGAFGVFVPGEEEPRDREDMP